MKYNRGARKNLLLKPEITVSNKANDMKQDMVLRSVAVIEEGSVIQRNKLMLEHVIVERQKDKDRVFIKASTLHKDGLSRLMYNESPAYHEKLASLPFDRT